MKFSTNTRVLVVGCGGMLGEAVHHLLSKRVTLKATDVDLNADWLEPLDVRDADAVHALVADFRPDCIVNLAALVDLEYCERNPADAYLTNAIGAENVVYAAQRHNAAVVYISTAGIFDGSKEVYDDYDLPNPISVYGRSKYAGELFVQQMLDRHYVFRAGWMMGGGPQKDKKFVNKIVKQLQSGKRTLHVVDDKLGTPTYTWNFAENMLRVVEAEQYGLYNMVSDGQCSRFDVAREIVSSLGLQREVAVEKVDSSFWQAEYFAPRPASEQLINRKLKLKRLNLMRHWRENLNLYLASHDWGLHTLQR